MDRRERAPPEAAGRQQEGVRGGRHDRAGGRRPERALRLPRRSGGGVFLPAQGQHGAQGRRQRQFLRRADQGGRGVSAAAACAALAATAGGLDRARGGAGALRRRSIRRLRVVLLRMWNTGAPHRGEGRASRPRPAAALRGLLQGREGAHLQEVRRAASRQEAAARLGEDLGRPDHNGPEPGNIGSRQRLLCMMLKAVIFLAVVLTALALIPYGAHLFSLPNKIGMTREEYFVAQAAYDGWALLGVVLIPAMLVNIVLAVMLRGEAGFACAVAGCIVMAATLAVFFAFTYPGNAATQNWKVAPIDWAELRYRWEYSHAANAGLIFASFCLIVLASITALAPRR